jgi:hypothetical protein
MSSQREFEVVHLIAYHLSLDSGPVRRHRSPEHAELPPSPQMLVVAVFSSCCSIDYGAHGQCHRRGGLVQGEGVHGRGPFSRAMSVKQVRVHRCSL